MQLAQGIAQAIEGILRRLDQEQALGGRLCRG